VAKTWTLYTYPSCTTARRAEAWLKEKGIEVNKVHIYNNPPDRAEIQRMASKLEGGVKQLIGTRGRAYKELGLAGKELSDEQWLDLIEETPRLLRRPILTDGERVLVGFSEAEWAERLLGSAG